MPDIMKVRESRGGKNGTSLIITLPKQICEELNITKDDHVRIWLRGKKINVERLYT